MIHSRRDEGDDTTLEIEGTLDAVTAPELRHAIDGIINDRRVRITLDLTRLRHIDSTGVGVVVSFYKRTRNYGAAVKLVGLKDQPLAIFRLLRLDRVFPI
ncbi:MAG TPA: STAS domain-containing protein [Vicinamibacterales bacterium]|nr:STAS domain-containing protein [Vicinamibacterales bacterium]